MSSRFRSQPNLQRSGGAGPRPWLLGLGAAVLLGGGAVLASRHEPPPAQPQVTQVVAAPSPGSPAPPGLMVEVVPAAPQALSAAPTPVEVAQGPAAVPAPQPVRRPAAQAEPGRDGRTAYAAALRQYQENERRAGYRWARQHNVTVPRYCAATEQRTEAFMRGCMAYLREALSG